MSKLKKDLTEALCDALQGKYLTIENVASYLVDSKLLNKKRLSQFLAMREFYDKYNEQSKASLVKTLAVKYEISERTMWDLVHVRRFSI